DIGERCGAGTNCGGCVPLIEDILESRLVALMNQSTIAEVVLESAVATSPVSIRRAGPYVSASADSSTRVSATHVASDPAGSRELAIAAFDSPA
ncbi:MAG TPA: hypothetical protein VL068_00680, partial [Microthrixaceae bacterium]|nr:hypothetical protein [Microthrixaceae bacterium]